MNKGYWNGEHAQFIGVTYEVSKSDGPLHWQNRHVGQRRQGLQITYGTQTWIIDNEFGDGFHKVTSGFGSPTCGHKSVFKPLNIQEIADSEIRTLINWGGMTLENQMHDDYIKTTDPVQLSHPFLPTPFLPVPPLYKYVPRLFDS